MKNSKRTVAAPAPLPIARHRTYYLENRDRLKAEARARYLATRDRRKVTMAAYNAANRDEIKARKRAYYIENQARLRRAYARAHYVSRKLAAGGLEAVLAKKRR